MKRSIVTCAVALVLAAWSSVQAADDPADKPAAPADQIAQLKAQLEEQQKMISQLQSALESQKKLLDEVVAASTPPRRSGVLGEVASTTPVLPPGPAVATPRILTPPSPQGAAQAAPAQQSYPTQLQLGNVTIMPVGFMDLTASWKDRNAGGSLGSNFGNIPYNTANTWHTPEFRFSPQNSRIGFRIDGNWKGTRFIGYNEFDFLGTSSANNLSVTNGAFVPRVRLYWVDLRKGEFEFLAGQSWSMMTPNRKGISALPGDLFYSQVVDVNYVIGLPWTRQPGMRVLYHPTEKVTFGLSFENPDAYIGGSGGSSSVVLPTGLAGLAGAQLDNQTSQQATPNLHPDIIAKLAFDPNSHVHFEFTGIERTFHIWNPNTRTAFSKAGGGGAFNANVELVKNFRFITNNLWTDGGGRYFFGNAPDLILRSDGSISPVHSGGTVTGFEATVKNFLLYTYYGGLYIRRNVTIDANGAPVGWGYRGASNGQNKTVQELTFGFNQTIWKDAKYGALNLMGQYQWLFRNPWYIAAGTPKSTHDNTVFVNVRYTLPGGVPAMK